MKALVCEMCGSHNLVKQNGLYVCQNCYTKYSVEEAKKLMIEGTVDVTGSTVKVDNTDYLNNLRQLARRARKNGNTEQAAKYYDMIVIQDPNDWESVFFSVYYQSVNTNIDGIISAANRVTNCIPTSIQLIKSYVPQEEQKAAYLQVVWYVTRLCGTFYKTANDHYTKYKNENNASMKYTQRNFASFQMVTQTANSVVTVFGDKQTALELYMYCYNSDSSISKDELITSITKIDPVKGQQMNISYTKESGNSMLKGGIIAFVLGLLATITGLSVNLILLTIIGVFIMILGVLFFGVGISEKKRSSNLQAEYDRTYNSKPKK